MRNRFNINESEKNRIKDLHGMQPIREQDTESTTVDLPDGKYMLRGNCRGYKILTRPQSWESVVIEDGLDSNRDDRAVLTAEHEKALYTGYDTEGPCARCPCEFEYNAIIKGGKLVAPSGRPFSGVITKGDGEAGSGDIAPPKGPEKVTNNVSSEGLKNVSDAMVNNPPFNGYIEGSTIGGVFEGTLYEWNCDGVLGMKNANNRLDRLTGQIVSEKNSYLKEVPNMSGLVVTDATPNDNWVGIYTGGIDIVVYQTEDGARAYRAKM